MHKVSIVLPTYNGARYLPLAIDSILRQTYHDWELIIVDDCSMDDTTKILKSYTDPRIRIVRNDNNCKLPRTLNIGFALSEGEYLTWTSDDNILAPNNLYLLVGFLNEHPEVDFVYTDYVLIDGVGKEIGRFHLEPLSNIKTMNICGACFMYRRRVYEVLGDYNEAVFMAEDYEYWLRAYRQFFLYHWQIDYPMYYYRVHDSSLTGVNNRWIAHELAVKLRRDILGLGWFEYNKQMAFVHVQAGYHAYQLRKPSDVCKRSIKAIIHNPLWLMNRGLLSITFQALRKKFSSNKWVS